MKITINNRDLPYTIDTYGMFTGEWCEDSEREHYADKYNLTDDEAFELGFDYNHKEIVRSLAIESVNLLENNLVNHNETNGIVQGISMPENTRSPQFYNYTTDSYDATWLINEQRLEDYAKKHKNSDGYTFQEFLLNTSWGLLDSESEDYIVAMLDFVLPSFYDVEDYEMAMFEHESEAYSENMTLDKESEALIANKERKHD